jgi:hypothetical protein
VVLYTKYTGRRQNDFNVHAQARVEEAGRVDLTDKEAAALTRTKAVHVGLIVVSCLLAVKLAGASLAVRLFGYIQGLMVFGLALPVLSLWVAGVAEVFVEGWEPQAAARHCGRMTLTLFGALVAVGFMGVVAAFGAILIGMWTGSDAMTIDDSPRVGAEP